MTALSFDDLATTYLPMLAKDVDTFFADIALPSVLDEACRYSIGAGGKRLRPLLVMSAFLAFGGRFDDKFFGMARRCALAVELLHGYSLIHDDLPCMDDAELRRGKPTCHIAYGESVALLAGDALQAVAFEVLTCAELSFGETDGALVADALRVFAPRARRMVSGQMLDVLGERRQLDADELRAIHKDKTGALIEASLLMGAVCARADEEHLLLLLEYAKAIGLAFQVQDDVLDASADARQLGKPAGSDEKLDKATYVKLLGLTQASAYAEELFAKADEIVKRLGAKYDQAYLLSEMVAWIRKRSA